jgi:Asp-tRNA(Asn)/Glu-tRNA(Gln) amidotransferase A subunit family amidase
VDTASWQKRIIGEIRKEVTDNFELLVSMKSKNDANNTHYGPTKNPYDFSRIPGGSSGGSGAAAAAALCAGAIGTDTGDSV